MFFVRFTPVLVPASGASGLAERSVAKTGDSVVIREFDQRANASAGRRDGGF
jgi:hypothetical protein